MSQCIAPSNSTHACDGGASGLPSVVASNVTGASAAEKFKSVINKKLACCLNAFDNAAQVKYDCVDNSTDTYANFDALWSSSDPADSGEQAFALVLSSGSDIHSAGKPITGFYTLAGARCPEFSEFGGILHGAKVNPGIVSSQQDKLSSTDPHSESCEISPTAYTVAPPASLATAMQTLGKFLPYDGATTHDCAMAARMRRCPILVRAALISSCPKNGMAPNQQNSYKDGGNRIHCVAAASITTHIRIEQLYEIAGSASMLPVDSLQKSVTVNPVSLANLITSKVGNACPANTTSHNGACMACPAGCGGQACAQCPANTYSMLGSIHCTSCPAGKTSPPGSTDQSACGP